MLLIACTTLATSADDELTLRLLDDLAKAKNAKMNFSQTLTNGDGTKASSKGSLAYIRPAKFRLAYSSPEELLVVSNGDKLWVHDVELQQVIVSKFGDFPGSKGLLTIFAANDILKTFTVNSREEIDGSIVWLTLKPNDAEELQFSEGEIGFNKEGIIITARFNDLLGNLIEANFKDIFLDEVTDAEFNFVPPDGIEVIEQ